MAALRQVLSGGKDGDMNGDVDRGGEIWWWSVEAEGLVALRDDEGDGDEDSSGGQGW